MRTISIFDPGRATSSFIRTSGFRASSLAGWVDDAWRRPASTTRRAPCHATSLSLKFRTLTTFDEITCDLDRHSGAHGRSASDKEATEDRETLQDKVLRRFVVKTVLIAILCALAVSGVYSLITGDWVPIKQVYLVVAAPFGAIFAAYIGKV